MPDEERPHLIGPRGAAKLFEQMKLSTEGVSASLIDDMTCPKANFPLSEGLALTLGLEA